MGEIRQFDAIAKAFLAEGVDTVFTLMGDGNMHWVTAMAQFGARLIHVRHEHAACAMAMGYYSATGRTGVASVTCGPGLTQTMTALTTAARAHIPMVVFAGESPINLKWYNQGVDQAPLVLATGAHYIAAHSPARMLDHVREAFYVAAFERRPVVLGIPHDLQKQMVAEQAYESSASLVPDYGRLYPDPGQIERLAERLAAAQRPIVVAGRGALAADASEAIIALADTSGALLATTLPTRGMFDDNPFSIGVAGGFDTKTAREQFKNADLIVAIGASLTYFTVDGGSLFPGAFVAQIDERPVGLKDGARAADLYVRADARIGAELLTRALAGRTLHATIRSDELADAIRNAPPDSDADEGQPGALDPRRVIAELDAVIPKDWDIISGSGHSSYFYTHMRNRPANRFHAIREFGAIGNGLGTALGVAAARNNGKVVLLEGDGSLLMHIQELETAQRQGLQYLVVCLNDGAFGAEIHKLRHEGVDDSQAVFGRPDFGSIARGFGLRGITITELGHLAEIFSEHDRHQTSEVWDIHISDRVVSPRMRRQTAGGH